jgi:hypothetical protein
VIKAADEFRDKTTAPNQLWQTDFTYLKVIGWGWFYLSTILDDYSRYIVAWKLCTTMKAGDVTDTLELALKASGCDQATVFHKPRLLSDNGSSYISGDLAEWLDDQSMEHAKPRSTPSSPTTIIGAITRAWATSPPPTSTSGAAKPSCWKGRRSNAKPSNTGACNTANPPPRMTNQMRQTLPYISRPSVQKSLTTDTQDPCCRSASCQIRKFTLQTGLEFN